MRRISPTIFCATSASRYSSRYFKPLPPGFHLLDHGRLELSELVQLAQSLVGAFGFRFINSADGESDMNEDIFADLCLRYVFQARFANDSAKLDPGHAQIP